MKTFGFLFRVCAASIASIFIPIGFLARVVWLGLMAGADLFDRTWSVGKEEK